MRRSWLLHVTLLVAGVAAASLVEAAARTAPLRAAVPVSGHLAPLPDLDGLDGFVGGALRRWGVPGVALAAIDGDRVVVSRGYGYADLETDRPVEPSTVFGIASLSKAFTATTLASLVDDGSLAWDRPVREIVSDFRLRDPEATDRATLRDLLSHRTGLPRHDLVWYGSWLDRAELVHRLRFLEPSIAFREGFLYQNLGYIAAAHVAESATGTAWDELVARRLLDPLDLSRTRLSVAALAADGDVARGHGETADGPRPVPLRELGAGTPAGGMFSNVEELARFLRLHMGDGEVAGLRLLEASTARELRTPQVDMQGAPRWPESSSDAYGMGFVLGRYRGHDLVLHEGGVDGFMAQMAMVPSRRVGVVVLSNLSGGNPVPSLVARNVLDRLLGLEILDWSDRLADEARDLERARTRARERGYGQRVQGTSPSHDLGDYAGHFDHPAYGPLVVRRSSDGLELLFRGTVMPLEHYHYDVFRVPGGQPHAGLKLTFLYDEAGRIDRVTVPFEERVDDIVFTRVTAPWMHQASFLDDFVGEYALGSATLVVALRDDTTLTLQSPEQPAWELVPLSRGRFDVVGLNGSSVEFVRDDGGRVKELVVYQSSGPLVAERR